MLLCVVDKLSLLGGIEVGSSGFAPGLFPAPGRLPSTQRALGCPGPWERIPAFQKAQATQIYLFRDLISIFKY